MSTHRLGVSSMAILALPLLAVAPGRAQSGSPTEQCKEPPGAVQPVPNVTASIRGEFLKGGKTLVQDIYLSTPDGSRIRAYLIRPYKPPAGGGGGGAVLFLHWLGSPPANDRSEFFEDAMRLADQNVTSLLVDAPWADPAWFANRKLEEDLANTAHYAAQLQGYVRYLLAEAKPNPDKVALVGHDFGAMYGTLVLRREKALRHAVVMAAVGDFSDWFLLGRKLATADSLAYRQRLAVLAPTHYLGCAETKDVLFQFADTDRFVTRAQAGALVDAAPAEKSVVWYPGGHELQEASRNDRVEWLLKRVGTISGQ